MIEIESIYFNPNTRGLTSNFENTAIKDRKTYDEVMSNSLPNLTPIDDIMQALNTPIRLARSPFFSKVNNSVNIAQGQRIRVNDGYMLTVKTQGVEVSGGNNPYDTNAYIKAQQMADSLASLLRNACGTLQNIGCLEEDRNWYAEGITNLLPYLGIDASKEFAVNGMRFHKDKNGWYESEAKKEAQEAYERLKANNMTYLLADEKTKKQIAYISNYYLETVPESVKTAWQEAMEETSVNPFPNPDGFSCTFTQLSTEQDFATGGNDNLLGDTKESCLDAVYKILERIENPLGKVTEKRAAYLQQEKKFYTALASKIESSGLSG